MSDKPQFVDVGTSDDKLKFVGLQGGIMPKLKTHKGAAKRFRLTATGKVKRGHSHARHILTKKSTKRKRLLDIDALVAEADQKPTKRMLPYGRN